MEWRKRRTDSMERGTLAVDRTVLEKDRWSREGTVGELENMLDQLLGQDAELREQRRMQTLQRVGERRKGRTGKRELYYVPSSELQRWKKELQEEVCSLDECAKELYQVAREHASLKTLALKEVVTLRQTDPRGDLDRQWILQAQAATSKRRTTAAQQKRATWKARRRMVRSEKRRIRDELKLRKEDTP